MIESEHRVVAKEIVTQIWSNLGNRKGCREWSREIDPDIWTEVLESLIDDVETILLARSL